MKRHVVLSLAVLLAPGLAAQQRDTVAQRGDSAEAGRLRTQIEDKFRGRVQEELERRRALEDQMQPGIAANSDSVRKLMDGIQTGRAEMLRIEQDQDREMAGYLTPVQRARYQQMRERLMQRIGEMRMERRETRGMRPGMRPGMVPRQGVGGGRGGRRRGI